jgi:hypothetical protein
VIYSSARVGEATRGGGEGKESVRISDEERAPSRTHQPINRQVAIEPHSKDLEVIEDLGEGKEAV